MKYCFYMLFSIFVSCSNTETISIPSDVLSKEKMSFVMLDVLLIESSMNVAGANPKKISVSLGTIPFSINILKKNKITKKQFDESYKFYTLNPKLLSEIYQNVLNDLSKMQAEINNKN